MAKEILVDGFELISLNKEFVELMKKHNEDMDVHGESREEFLNFGDAEDEEDLKMYHAAICNAWDELCSLHSGLRESELHWYAGVEFTSFPDNDWGVYIGTGDELD